MKGVMETRGALGSGSLSRAVLCWRAPPQVLGLGDGGLLGGGGRSLFN